MRLARKCLAPRKDLPGSAGSHSNSSLRERTTRLRWAIIFFVIAIVAAIFGFGGIAADAAWIGKIFCFIFLILFVVSLIRGRKGPPME